MATPVSTSRHGPGGSGSAVSAQPPRRRSPPGSLVATVTAAAAAGGRAAQERHRVPGGRALGVQRAVIPGEPAGMLAAQPQRGGGHQQLVRVEAVRRGPGRAALAASSVASSWRRRAKSTGRRLSGSTSEKAPSSQPW